MSLASYLLFVLQVLIDLQPGVATLHIRETDFCLLLSLDRCCFYLLKLTSDSAVTREVVNQLREAESEKFVIRE
jgi:hypothetical protein